VILCQKPGGCQGINFGTIQNIGDSNIFIGSVVDFKKAGAVGKAWNSSVVEKANLNQAWAELEARDFFCDIPDCPLQG
jgi:hypothetical protein